MEDSSDLENISVVVEDIKSFSAAREARGCSADVGDYDGAEDNDGEFDYNEEVKHRPPTKKAPNDCNKPPSPNGNNVGERTTLVPQRDVNAAQNHLVHLSRSKEEWRGDYRCVPLCRNSSAQNARREELGMPRVSFHSFPDVNTEKGKQWIAKIRRDPGLAFTINKYTKICSQHFTADDFVTSPVPGYSPVRSRLKASAVPTVFSWNAKKQRETVTSKIASLAIQRKDYQLLDTGGSSDVLSINEDVDSFHVEDSFEPVNFLDEVDHLRGKVSQLQAELELAKDAATKSLFRLQNIKDNDEDVKYYTGFPDYATLLAFFEVLLESDATVMRQWDGKNCKSNYDDESKRGRHCKLPLLEQFFLTLVRLRLGLFEYDLSKRFDISQATVSRITATWINLLYRTLKGIETFPPWHIVKKYMPESFKKQYPDTRVIIDATEFYVERPSSLLSQCSTFSAYKNNNTVKVLIGITPSGVISFVSKCYEGSISDRKLVEVSGLLEKLEPGDQIMADKGFQIQDLLAPLGVQLTIPPFLASKAQMATSDVIVTKKIANLRVHVERAIGRVKEF
ncbi:uncharacterized protein [Dysidea avara]|uniref:uncharacterized protein isoform X2 n=1 Tax=Dysidea avara TaxID=196820 RepID=UPI00331AE46C